MNRIAIIQARMGSTRLPGKILSNIEGKTMLERIIERVSAAELVDKVVVATSVEKEDDAVEAYIKKYGYCDLFRGSVDDVLSRFYECAKEYNASIIIRITADDPLKDPQLIDKAVAMLLKDKDLDYCSNTIEPSYPEGLDIEVFRYSALETAFNEAVLPSEREHVTPFIWKNPEKFKIQNFKLDRDLSTWRWTVDKQEDLEFMRSIFKKFKDKPMVSFEEVIQFLEAKPELMKINSGKVRNEGYIKSLIQEN
jgi:spore coat polysaccharide biosynthesis protein SpsF